MLWSIVRRLSSLLITSLSQVDVLEIQRLAVQDRRVIEAIELPGRCIREVLVVAQCLAFGCLELFAEMPAAGLGPPPSDAANPSICRRRRAHATAAMRRLSMNAVG